MSNKASDAHEEVDSDDEAAPPLLVGEKSAEEKAAEAEEAAEDTTLQNSDVTTKYQEAAKIANAVVAEVAAMCVEGAAIRDICEAGDKLIVQRTQAIYRGKSKSGKPIDRGVAFPVCISVNEILCHVTPLNSDNSYPPLKNDDFVKIDLGVHIDGYIAVVAHTVIVGMVPNPEQPVTGPKADVLAAAWAAANVAAKLIKPGNTNAQVTAAIKQVSDAYGVKAIAGTVMHQMKRFVIDGNKTILLRSEPDLAKVDACTFEQYEVYAVDVAMSTGEGRPRDMGERCTVYKRAVDKKYSLKSKASRQVFNEVNKLFPTMPFTMRSLSDEKAAKLGIRECVNHGLIEVYNVVSEHKGDIIAHVKFTVLLLAGGNVKVTGLAMPAGFSSDKALPADLAELISKEDVRKKKSRGGKKKSSANGGAEKASS